MMRLFKKPLSIESWLTITISLAAGFILCGYEFLRGPSNTLYSAAYGANNLPIVMAMMPLGVMAILYLYGRLLTKLGPRRTLFLTTIASGFVIFLCYVAIQKGWSLVTGVLYIFREAYIVLLIEQYWSFINSTLGRDAARKLNGPIIGIASLGAILGGILLYHLAESLGTANMLLFCAASVVPAAFLSDLGYRKCGEPKSTGQEIEKRRGHLGLSLFKTSPMLTLLFLLVMTTQLLSNVLGLSFQIILQDSIPNIDQQSAYQGKFYATVNGVAACLQFIAAPIILSIVPLGIVHLGIPLIHMLAAVLLIAHPSLQTAALAFLLFKSIDYSLFRATKEILYIPLSFDSRYRAKEIIDVFGYRLSKGGSSLIIAVIQKMGIIMNGFYSWISLGGAFLWICLIIPILQHLPANHKWHESEKRTYE